MQEKPWAPARLLSRETIYSCLILLAIVWFGSFFECYRFSLYADDWSYLGWEGRAPWGFGDWFNGIMLYAAGRPLQWSLIYLCGVVEAHFQSLLSAYLLLFFITAASVLATWRLLRVRFSNAVALAAAAIFAMSPLVSVRPFLNGIASPTAFLFLMAATALYISNRRVLSYFCATLVLLSYELVFPLFVLLPVLLKPLETRRDLYRLIVHAMICAAMIGAFAYSMRFYGGDRLGDVIAGHSPVDVGFGIMRSTARSLPHGAFESVDVPLWLGKVRRLPGAYLWVLPAFAAFIVLLQRAPARAADGGAGGGERRLWAQTLGVLVLMIIAGYGLIYFAFDYGAAGVLGRISRFHSAANLPFSILTGLGLVWVLDRAQHRWSRNVVVVAEAGYLALMFAFSVSHQSDFVKQTERQRLVVTQLAIDHPMMDPDATFVIRFEGVEQSRFPAIEYEDSHSWYPLLGFLFEFPQAPGGKVGPSIRIIASDAWTSEVSLGSDGRLRWPASVWPHTTDTPGHIWYYSMNIDGKLRSLQAPILVEGRNILHEGPGDGEGAVNLAKLRRMPLFDKLMQGGGVLLDAIARNATSAESKPAVAP